MKPQHRLQYAAQAYAHARMLVETDNWPLMHFRRATLVLFKEAFAFTEELNGGVPDGDEEFVLWLLDMLEGD